MPLSTLQEFEQICNTHSGNFRRPLSRCTPRRGRRFFSHPSYRDRNDPSPEEFCNLEVIDGFKPIYTAYDCYCCITGHLIKEHDVIFWSSHAPRGRATLSIEGYAMHTEQIERMKSYLLRREGLLRRER